MSTLSKWIKDKKFIKADEVELIAIELLNKHHPHLLRAKIDYLFVKENKPKNGRVKLGHFEIPNEKVKHYNGYDFIMEISWKHWCKLTPLQKKALVDHELCHGGVRVDKKGKIKFILIGHDVEEFKEIVGRYGFWKDDLRDFGETCKGVIY